MLDIKCANKACKEKLSELSTTTHELFAILFLFNKLAILRRKVLNINCKCKKKRIARQKVAITFFNGVFCGEKNKQNQTFEKKSEF